MVYVAAAMTVVIGVGSLAVDFGRVQVAQTELQNATDAAARYAAAGLRNRVGKSSAAANNARVALQDLTVDGGQISFDASKNLVLGIWNATTRKFTATDNPYLANAVKVNLDYTVGGNGSSPLTLLSLLGRDRVKVNAEAIMAITTVSGSAGNGDGTFTYWVPATSNPWLAGNTSGTAANPGNPHKNPDYAGTPVLDDGVRMDKSWLTQVAGYGSSDGTGTSDSDNEATSYANYANWGSYASKKSTPIQAGGISVTPGAAISFANLNGGANNSSSSVVYSADGNLDWIVSNYKGKENGKSDLSAPINSVVAVFLSNDDPGSGSTPEALDFSTAESRDFQTLKPKLKQVFYIGDGLRSNGETQQFIAPTGATRLFIGTMDGYEWNNNIGGFEVNAIVATKVSLVK
ncbi:MAG: pilus assembly protein TadG-related protein [Tepidisphaeraceae bacterium]